MSINLEVFGFGFAPISNRAFMALSVVADLVSTLRYLNRGIIDTRPVSVYPILCELRMHIAAVRMGWTREDSGQKSQL
ncbi:hypothetical protein SARC_08439 [Sphaeroforma arctica JP610]|uniref:Uncharacterized protein n=1 Tax=Sphaeroforma arctica JP610 TaxID=667725 RepID=A0A0L0FR49_9EUKA|nr:hypothetical protein SARC_08439 [Sphaeroforma arctica JP610]KNC79159.1 hypothetical protein SARC_08439 [Sphaeroforma arctica JP610]|eukprot:XP_014153061.1 hypothetical protein SARC_08439 [Sphaeroforma arctica JP610]